MPSRDGSNNVLFRNAFQFTVLEGGMNTGITNPRIDCVLIFQEHQN